MNPRVQNRDEIIIVGATGSKADQFLSQRSGRFLNSFARFLVHADSHGLFPSIWLFLREFLFFGHAFPPWNFAFLSKIDYSSLLLINNENKLFQVYSLGNYLLLK